MAISWISPSNANLSDTSTSLSAQVTGKTSGSELTWAILVHGTNVGSGSTFSNSFTMSFSQSSLYSALNGKSLSGAVAFTISEIVNGNIIGSISRTGGSVTINRRLSSLSISSLANPYNLDSITNIISSWSRPHTAFRGRITVYVNNVYCFSRYGFSTSTNINPESYSGYVDNMINAMGGSSPKVLKVVIQSQFNSTSIIDLGGGLLEDTVSVVKSFIAKGNLTGFSAFTIGNNIPFTMSAGTGGLTYQLELKFGSTSILSRTVTGSGSIVPTSGEITAMYNATSSVEQLSATLILKSYNGATLIGESSLIAVATVGAGIMPNFTTVTHSENVSNVATLIGGYVQTLSKLNLAITGAVAGTGATISSYKITVAGQTINAVSGVSGFIGSVGTVAIVGRVTDSRGRWVEKTVNITVLPYGTPLINSFSVQRANSGGVASAIGDYLRVNFNASVSSLIVGTEKNTLRYEVYYKLRTSVTYILLEGVNHTGISYNSYRLYSGFPIENAYDVQLRIIDKFNTVLTTAQLSTGRVPMSWGEFGIGVGKVVEGTRVLDVGGDIWEDGQRLADKYASAGSYAPLVHSHDAIDVYDVRSYGTGQNFLLTPNDLQAKRVTSHFGFLPEVGGAWKGLLNVKGWDGAYAGWQLIGNATSTNDEGLFFRTGVGTGWLPARQVWHSGVSDVIESSGAGSNQWWIKFSDGTLIKRGFYDLTVAIATGFGNIFISAMQTLTYDTSVAFNTSPSVVMSSRDGTGNSRTTWGMINGGSSANFTYQLGRATSAGSQLWYISWIAIGRWK